MSIGEIGGVIGPCEECRHTHGTSSCATCGGGIGYIGPPTLAPCRACLDGIAATPAIAAGGDDDELILVDDEAQTEVLDRADVVAALAPINETWRKTWTECADLLKAVAEKDPAAAAGYVARCRDWLTRAVQYGS